MFADDTKMWAIIKNEEDADKLHMHLDRLMEWSDRWLPRQNSENCKIMHIGQEEKHREYTLWNCLYTLKETTEERDLGILVRNDLKPFSQCAASAAKARSVLGLIRNNLKHLDKDDFLILYKTYVRPRMEYCIQVWSPHLVKDVQILEKVQKKAVKLIKELQKLSYKERLTNLGLPHWKLEDKQVTL